MIQFITILIYFDEHTPWGWVGYFFILSTKSLRMRNKLLLAAFCFPIWAIAQQNILLTDMSAWKQEGGKNWQIVADAAAELSKHDVMTSTAGTGVLLNLPDKTNRANLLSVAEYGDVDVSFDFMMAAHSNSGFYLMGRYEVQLLDSWGVKTPGTGDCGGIYKRRRFEGEKEILWEGHAPKQNACLAPGLWQHMDISFQAPRFDASGKKTANAKYLKIVMNGVTLHENVEMTGPTGGPISEEEAATGPFMIQGDHGPVAFKNFKVTDFKGKNPEMGPINFKVYYGTFKKNDEFLSKIPDSTGTIDKLTWEVSNKDNEFAQVFSTKLKVPQAGAYTFTLQGAGHNTMRVNNVEIMPDALKYTSNKRIVPVNLEAGEVPIEIIVYKYEGFIKPILGLTVAGPATRPVAFHSFTSLLTGLGTPNDPILLDTKENMVFRSFMDIPQDGKNKRIVHNVNVGSMDKLHYSYDLDNGAIAQIWKGDFLNTSPMWDNRGDGSSRPRGAVLTIGNTPSVVNDNSKTILKDSMTADANFKTMGYDLDNDNLPTFKYQIYGSTITDICKNTEGGKFLTRSISVKNPSPNLSVRLAIGKNIEAISPDTYLIDGKTYYIKLLNGTKATVEKVGDKSILLSPLKDLVQYAIIW
jgi:Domain of Unknown Function (DUF1080)/PA14 domain